MHTDSQIFLHVVHEVRQHLPRHRYTKHERSSGARTIFNHIVIAHGARLVAVLNLEPFPGYDTLRRQVDLLPHTSTRPGGLFA